MCRPLDHRYKHAVVNTGDFPVVVLVAVSLEDRQNFARILQHLSDLSSILHAVTIAHIKPLMDEHDRLALCFFEIRPKPLDLICWYVRIGPVEVFATIRLPVAAKTRIEDDEMKPA